MCSSDLEFLKFYRRVIYLSVDDNSSKSLQPLYFTSDFFHLLFFLHRTLSTLISVLLDLLTFTRSLSLLPPPPLSLFSVSISSVNFAVSLNHTDITHFLGEKLRAEVRIKNSFPFTVQLYWHEESMSPVLQGSMEAGSTFVVVSFFILSMPSREVPKRSEEHTSELSHPSISRMPSSA